MKILNTLASVITILLISCNSSGKKKSIQDHDTITAIENKQIEQAAVEFVRTEIVCDSFYRNKKYKITVSNFSNETSYDEGVYNSIFKFHVQKNGKYQESYIDSIQRHFDEVLFEDFNNDDVNDILIENISDARSNVTYYLYLVDTTTDKLQKVKNFESIKNPRFLPKYNLIDNEVMSGREWTSFYQIQSDCIFEFNYVIKKGMNDDGTIVDFDREYNKTLQKVLKNKNYR